MIKETPGDPDAKTCRVPSDRGGGKGLDSVAVLAIRETKRNGARQSLWRARPVFTRIDCAKRTRHGLDRSLGFESKSCVRTEKYEEWWAARSGEKW